MTVDTDHLHALLQEHLTAGRRRSMWIDAASPVDLPEVDLPADPWLLGAWLGDGTTSSGEFTVGRLDGPDMITAFKERWTGRVSVTESATAYSIHLGKRDDQCTYGHSSFRAGTPGHRTRRCAQESDHRDLEPTNLPFATHLSRAAVRESRHIPPVYLRAGTQQRIDLLRGLMDTDGWWDGARNRAGFTTTDGRLAHDVLELLRTLGVVPTHFAKPCTDPIRTARTWHVIDFTPGVFNPFRLPRKALECDRGVSAIPRANGRRRIISSVEPIETVPTQCVTVRAADSLYLCGEGFVPTHNTGRAPSEGWEAKALFQMKFYALVLWRTRGVLPAMLQLVYLGSGELLRYVPDEQDLVATERKVEAIWRAIAQATEDRDWRPRRSRLCDWCAHRTICPEWGGTPPPLPEVEPADPGELTAEDLD